ncbi:MAG: hypothetical protein H7232_09080 [Aeromicrobium sp.]|nr:hypothetical protein [Burkholderiales bacterium]
MGAKSTQPPEPLNFAQRQYQRHLDDLKTLAKEYNISFADAVAAMSKPPEQLRWANALRDKTGNNPQVLIDYYRTIFYEKKILEQVAFINEHWPAIQKSEGHKEVEKHKEIDKEEFAKAVKAHKSRKTGGDTRAKQLAAEKKAKHQLIKDALKKLPQGIKPHAINGRLALDLGMQTDYVRRARKEMGLVSKKK